jgi:hypothetical protein
MSFFQKKLTSERVREMQFYLIKNLFKIMKGLTLVGSSNSPDSFKQEIKAGLRRNMLLKPERPSSSQFY